jgi:hypothetical protein
VDNDRKTYNTILALLKGRGTFACIVGLFLALVIGRGVTEVFNSNSTPQAIANFIASVIVFSLVIGIAVFFRKNGKELFEGADEEPPFGRAPSMPEHYQKFYEGKELKPNSFGELALERQTGARGLRAICEEILKRPMFELPGRKDVERVVVHEDCVTNNALPEYVPRT